LLQLQRRLLLLDRRLLALIGVQRRMPVGRGEWHVKHRGLLTQFSQQL
jgi:hypothetical protein